MFELNLILPAAEVALIGFVTWLLSRFPPETPGYSDAEVRLVRLDVEALIESKSRSGIPEWARLLRELMSFELETGPHAEASLTASALAERTAIASGKRVSAAMQELRQRIAEYYVAPLRTCKVRVVPASLGYSVSFTRMNRMHRLFGGKLTRHINLTRHLKRYLPPPVFLIAATNPALWILTCRLAGWSYYLGGFPPSYPAWHPLAWGAVSALPLALYCSTALRRSSPITTPWSVWIRISALAVLQIVTAAHFSWIFYTSPVRLIAEGWPAPRWLQELIVASIWSSLFAFPMLLSCAAFFTWSVKSAMRNGLGRVVAGVTLVAAVFQAIVPAGAPTGSLLCGGHLGYGPGGGIIIGFENGCTAISGAFLFDHVRGMVAGVALPYFTIDALKHFLHGVSSGKIRARKPPAGL